MSSTISNIVQIIYRANGSQAQVQSRLVAHGISGIGREINNASIMSSRFNNQWRAIGTTMRYAVAGGVVFGLARMVTQLKEVQVQLGLISAIGVTPGGGQITGNNLNKLLAQSEQGAVDALTPMKEYNDAVINLLSTVQNVPEDQITPIVTQIAQAAKLAQISAEDATKAFTTMNVAFGRPTNLKNIRQIAQEFFILTKEAPGGTTAGPQIIGQLGQLAQVTRLANGSPEDMFGLLLSTLRGGIPPSQAGRGLQYMLQTLALPSNQTKDTQQALSSVGITTRSNLTLQQRIGRVFARARQLGVGGTTNALTKMDDETLSNLGLSEDTALTPGVLGQFGITGQGAEFLGKVFHRVHALRTALAILGQANVGQAQADVVQMNDSVKGHVKDVDDLAKQWKKLSDEAVLQKAAIAIEVLRVQIAKDAEPLLNFVGHGMNWVGGQARHHRTATKIAAGGIGVGLAAFGISRFLRGGSGGSIVAGLSGVGAVRDLSHQGLGASPVHPMYVAVVADLSRGVKVPGLGRAAGETEGVAGGAARRGFLRRVGTRAAVAGGAAGLTYGVPAAFALGTAAVIYEDIHGGFGLGKNDPRQRAIRGSADIRQFVDVMQHHQRSQEINPRWQRVWEQFQHGAISGSQLQKMLGRADVYMQIDLNKDGKVITKRVHIPVDLWKNGRGPSTRGKKATKNG